MKLTPVTDEKELLLKLREGDYHAFDALYNRYAAVTLAKIRKLVHLAPVAEELHQDVFMNVWEQRERLPEDVPFRAIVLRIAKSAAYNFYRKAAYDRELQAQLTASATELYNQVEEHTQFEETNDRIMAVIARLPEQRQRIFRFIKLDGKSYEEAAAEFGISLSTVKDHMARALKFLRTELAQQHPASFIALVVGAVFTS